MFSSRRDDGSYTRPYIAYFDKQGKTRKAFMLPQEDPVQNLMLLKSYNVPELTKEPTSYTFAQLKEAVYTQNPGTDIKYKELRTPDQIKQQQKCDTTSIYADGVPANIPQGRQPAADATTGASPKADATTGASPKAK